MRYERLLSYLQRVTGTLRTQKEALQPPCAALLPFEHCILLSDLASNRHFITTCCKIFVPHLQLQELSNNNLKAITLFKMQAFTLSLFAQPSLAKEC